MKYTSDELESLKDIFRKDKLKNLKKNFWMYEQEYKANNKLMEIKANREEYMALPKDEQKNFNIPLIENTENDTKNNLFFEPDFSNINKDFKDNFKMQIEYSNNFSANLSSLKEKSIQRENTRLSDSFINKLNQNYLNKVRKRTIEEYERSDVVKLMKDLEEYENKNSNSILPTPIINGYKIIKETKEKPVNVNDINLFTWGEIASTPNILKEKKYSVPQTPKREDIAHQLANNTKSNIKKSTVLDDKYKLTPSAVNLINSIKRSKFY